MVEIANRSPLSDEQRRLRKRYLGATVVTCIVVTLLGGTIHVIELGSNRMEQMRDKAGIDLAEESKHIRAAGEDAFLTQLHEGGVTHNAPFSVDEVKASLNEEQWTFLSQESRIPAGSFFMGTDNIKADAQNKPKHKVSTKSYYIDTTPVTVAEYALFIAEKDYRPPISWKGGKFNPEQAMHPVTMISWYDAVNYCSAYGKRLPTEIEWEKAARGEDGRRWPWGDQMDPSRLNTYYSVGSTTVVGQYPSGASPYGVLDMAGNVQEWVDSKFLPYQGSEASEQIFQGKIAVIPEDKKMQRMSVAEFESTEERYKVMRGGSWKGDPFSTQAYHRNYSWPNMTSDFYGFRCARDENS